MPCFSFESLVGGGQGSSQSELRFEDVDGDGKVDRVLKMDEDNTLHVQLNQLGKANLMSGFVGPHGRTVAIDYTRQGNVVIGSSALDPFTNEPLSVDMPENQWAMTKVTASDGQAQSLVTTFDYFNSGFYDRDERENLGYAHVRTTRPDGSRSDQYFHNHDYYQRHLPTVTLESRADAMLFSRIDRTWESRDTTAAGNLLPSKGRLPVEVERKTSFYEFKTADPLAPALIATRETRDTTTSATSSPSSNMATRRRPATTSRTRSGTTRRWPATASSG